MLKFTLDTNCIIDVDCKRPSAPAVIALADAAKTGRADVALVASSASERQAGDYFLENFEVFQDRASSLGFGNLPILRPIARWGMAFWGHGVWDGPELRARENAIYRALFPQSPYEWADYATSKGVDPEDKPSPAYFRWRNQILDAQAYWAHENARRDIFVTSDGRFKVLEENGAFPSARICLPEEALATLQRAL